MVEIIDKLEEIQDIINNKIKGKKLVFSDWYEKGILKRGIAHERVIEIFPQFQKVTKIEKELLKFGDMGYELFYALSNNLTFSIATCPKDKNVLIIHAVEYKRSLEKRFKKFKL